MNIRSTRVTLSILGGLFIASRTSPNFGTRVSLCSFLKVPAGTRSCHSPMALRDTKVFFRWACPHINSLRSTEYLKVVTISPPSFRPQNLNPSKVIEDFPCLPPLPQQISGLLDVKQLSVGTP